jgi:hypothetical protein
MAESIQMRLPDDPLLLEEINLPEEMVQTLAGKTVFVEVFDEEESGTRQVEPDDYPLLIDRDGKYWNDYRPLRALYTGADGRVWRVPRRWLPGWPANVEPAIGSESGVSRELAFTEAFQMPTFWDLWEINIPMERVMDGPGMTEVEVRVSPPDSVRIFWCDEKGSVWRLPHDWRRRRIQLPAEEVLAEQGIPAEIAAEYAHKILSVNYHPGSLCCLRAHYRFRDGGGQRWPIRIEDCLVLGYGDATEGRA